MPEILDKDGEPTVDPVAPSADHNLSNTGMKKPNDTLDLDYIEQMEDLLPKPIQTGTYGCIDAIECVQGTICTLTNWQTLDFYSHLLANPPADSDTHALPTEADLMPHRIASLSTVAAVAACLHNLFQRKAPEAEHIAISLCPQTILLRSPEPSLDELKEREGIFLSLEAADTEKRGNILRYMAPELRDFDSAQALTTEARRQAAVFSLGLILVDCLSLEAPFCMDEDSQAHKRIRNGEIPSLEGIDNVEHVSFIKDLLRFDPKDRPTLWRVAPLMYATIQNIEMEESTSHF